MQNSRERKTNIPFISNIFIAYFTATMNECVKAFIYIPSLF